MGKPSLKTTNFKQHPVYIQKALHVDNPFYGLKPQYQRAEIIPGGDCNTVADFTAPSAAFTVAASGDARVGTNSILLTQVDASTTASVYLLLSGPIDLGWAKFVGMWLKGGANKTYDPADIYLYIFTKAGNYLYANRARSIDFFPAQYLPGATPRWIYKEFDLEDFAIATGYEGDKLNEVWGIGWYSATGDNTNTLNIDQIEFYTHGTTKGPARGLIMSAPLYDDIHAERGYGLAWNEFSGRVDHSATDDYAFAGICVGNPSRTRLSQDVTGGTDTTLHVIDASLFRPGKATINDDSVAMESVTITAVNTITKTLTLSTAITGSFTVANNAYACMEGNEEGTTRVDFVVNGVVNLQAAQAVLQGYGCTCAAAGDAPLTVNQAAAGEQGQIIGKAVMAASGTGEYFPVNLTTDAYATGHEIAELLCKFEVGQNVADLLGKTNVNHP